MKYLIQGTRKTSGEEVQITVIAHDQDHAEDQAVTLGLTVAKMSLVNEPTLIIRRPAARIKRKVFIPLVILGILLLVIWMIIHSL